MIPSHEVNDLKRQKQKELKEERKIHKASLEESESPKDSINSRIWFNF